MQREIPRDHLSTCFSSCFDIKAQGSDTAPEGGSLLSSICPAALTKQRKQTNLQQTKHLLWLFFFPFHSHINLIISIAPTFPYSEPSIHNISKTSYC